MLGAAPLSLQSFEGVPCGGRMPSHGHATVEGKGGWVYSNSGDVLAAAHLQPIDYYFQVNSAATPLPVPSRAVRF